MDENLKKREKEKKKTNKSAALKKKWIKFGKDKKVSKQRKRMKKKY